MNTSKAKGLITIGAFVTVLSSMFLCAAGCRTSGNRGVQQAVSAPASKQAPALSREEVLERFRARASQGELRQMEQLRASRQPGSQDQALELIFSKLTSDEVRAIGLVTGLEKSYGPGPNSWHVADSDSLLSEVVRDLLEREGIGCGCQS